MAIVTLGIDLAKNVFALHGVDAAGKAALVRPSAARQAAGIGRGVAAHASLAWRRARGAHHWARLFQAYGHTVRLMAPKFVAP